MPGTIQSKIALLANFIVELPPVCSLYKHGIGCAGATAHREAALSQTWISQFHRRYFESLRSTAYCEQAKQEQHKWRVSCHLPELTAESAQACRFSFRWVVLCDQWSNSSQRYLKF